MLTDRYFANNLFFWIIEYDDGDGDQGHDDGYNSSVHQSTPNKRKMENGSSSNDLNDTGYDETDELNEGESSSTSEGAPKKKRRREFQNLNATFMAGIHGVHLVTDQVNHFFISFIFNPSTVWIACEFSMKIRIIE